MKVFIGILFIGAVFNLALGAPASHLQQIDWQGVSSKLTDLRNITLGGFEAIATTAIRDNAEIGTDIEYKLKESYTAALEQLNELRAEVDNRTLIPFTARVRLFYVGSFINDGYDEIYWDLAGLSESAQEEIFEVYLGMVLQSYTFTQEIMEMICAEDNSQEGCQVTKFSFDGKKQTKITST